MHNSHFQVLVNNGIVGYLVWFAMVASVTWMMFIRLLSMQWPFVWNPIVSMRKRREF